LVVGVAFVGFGCGHNQSSVASGSGNTDTPEVQLGERLFLETRFAQFFFQHSNDNVNASLAAGDPVMDVSVTTSDPVPGPFRGQSMNCRSCHLVDELKGGAGRNVRTYGDFARRSPIPTRADGQTATARNSPTLVNATLPREVPLSLHFDGEFASSADLVKATLTGRNFGWLPTERATAITHVADVIRGDNGKGDLAGRFDGSLPYRLAFVGTDPSIPADERIPVQYRVDVTTATDDRVLDAVASLITAYLDELRFSTDADPSNPGSPYDVFLVKNALPRNPDEGESKVNYSRRLSGLIQHLQSPVFVTPADGTFQFHPQPFQFGATELAGLITFLTQPDEVADSTQAVGNCAACHPAPDFTDFRFHNTGASQQEYDSIHGNGAFAALNVPSLPERNASFDAYLPPSVTHPAATGMFRSVPSAGKPGFTDLGVWNVFANPDLPAPQSALTQILCTPALLEPGNCTAAALLPLTIGRFKTPTVRDLGQSAPYLHTGQKDTIEDVIRFYLDVSDLAHAGRLRNTAPELDGMALNDEDIAPLAAFLRALNEDYE
jgi:cytochrome c peroxidase